MFDSITPTVRILTHDHQVNCTRGTILIVEDHADSREMLCLLFGELGYDVLEAKDGFDALRIVSDTDLDLIITDLGLPAMDGLELIRRVRTEGNNANDPKIALLTAYDRKDCLAPALQAGCDLVVAKPLDMEKIDRLLDLLPEDSQSPFCVENSNQFCAN